MKKLFLIFFLSFISYFSQATIITKQFNISGYGNFNVVQYIPANATGKLPTLIFYPGSGESNSNVNGLYVNGPLKFIQAGWSPSFIVVGIQPNNGLPTSSSVVDKMLTLVFNDQVLIDTNKFALTGLSYGAASIMGYFQSTGTIHKPIALIPMSINIYGQCGSYYDNSEYLCGTDSRFANTPTWGFCGTSDSFWDAMSKFFILLNKAGYPNKFTAFSGGHCCWNTYYDPNYKESGISIYDWMLQIDLPVIWGYFQYNEYLDQLEWSAQGETNNDRYEIQESDDGINFKTIGTVPSQNIQGEAYYTYKF